jgi:uncharacterized protein (DUF433 family)
MSAAFRAGSIALTSFVAYSLSERRLWCASSGLPVNLAQMGGQPCIRGLRIPVATVVAMVADGMSVDEIVAALPDLTPEDVSEALHDAAAALQERIVPLLDPA